MFLIISIPCVFVVVILRPYKELAMNIILIINEAMVIIFSLVFLIFAKESMFARGVEWIIIVVFIVYFTAIAIFAVIEAIKDVVVML